jgi:hypothetical protein
VCPHCLDWNLNAKRPGATSDNGFILKKINKNESIKETNRSYGRFLIYQLISTANPALFEGIRAELAVVEIVLFSGDRTSGGPPVSIEGFLFIKRFQPIFYFVPLGENAYQDHIRFSLAF